MSNHPRDMTYDMASDHVYEVYHAVTNNPSNMAGFHAHDYYECYLYLSGNIDIAIEGRLYTPKPYDMFIFPPGVMHRWVAKAPVGRYERVFFYITRECLESMSTPEFSMLDILDSAVEHYAYGFHVDVRAGTGLIALADEAIRYSNLTEPADRLLARCMVNMLAVAFCRLVNPGAEESFSIPGRMREIITYINDHITEPLTLDGLAEHFFVSKYYLLHAFKEYANLSVYQYILSKRIMLAQRLMRDGATPGAAARASGFGDYAGFYRAFVKQTGVTPQAFCNGGANQPEAKRESLSSGS